MQQAPARYAVRCLVQKFELTGSVCDNKNGVVGRHGSAYMQDIVAHVCKVLLESEKTCDMRFPVTQYQRTSTPTTMQQDLTLYLYKNHVQMVTASNMQQRCEFCQDFLQFKQQYPATLDGLWFSDEAHFHLSGS
jgi:hypothetical protein